MAVVTQSSSTPSGLELKMQEALEGVQTVLAAKSSLPLNGGTTQAQLIAQITGYVDTLEAVDTAKQSYAEAVATRKTDEPAMREFLVQLRAALLAMFGRGNPQLAKFGMSAPKPTKLKPTTAVLAAAQSQLTRAQRGTMSKKQRTSITVVGPPQVTVGAGGKLTVSPPTVNTSQSVTVASGAVVSSGAVAASSPASGQVPAAAVETPAAITQPASVAAQPAIVSPVAALVSK